MMPKTDSRASRHGWTPAVGERVAMLSIFQGEAVANILTVNRVTDRQVKVEGLSGIWFVNNRARERGGAIVENAPRGFATNFLYPLDHPAVRGLI